MFHESAIGDIVVVMPPSSRYPLTDIAACDSSLKVPGRLIFIHLQCWEVLPFCRFQRQRCIKIRVLRAQDFYTPLALKRQRGSTSQHWRCIKISLPVPPPHQKHYILQHSVLTKPGLLKYHQAQNQYMVCQACLRVCTCFWQLRTCINLEKKWEAFGSTLQHKV